jgi:hypothetical protein
MDPRFRNSTKSVMIQYIYQRSQGFSPPGIKTGEDAENSLNTGVFVSIKEHYTEGHRVLQQFLESARF